MSRESTEGLQRVIPFVSSSTFPIYTGGQALHPQKALGNLC